MQTIGNLTILTGALNLNLTNSAWAEERPNPLLNSLLPINVYFRDRDAWDEAEIAKRSEDLFARALMLWPRK